MCGIEINNKLRVATVCSGIGAPEKALDLLGIPYELLFFSEIEERAVKSYCAIHNETPRKNFGDLAQIDTQTIPSDIDLLVGGTPCQDFSIAGKQQGGVEGSGTRSSLMWYYIRLISLTKPKAIVWENVPNVLSNKHISNYRRFYHTLNAIGYKVYGDLVNAKYYNVPQQRLRLFVVAIRKDIESEFTFPYGYDSGIRLRDVLQRNVPKEVYTKCLENVEIFDKPKPNGTHEIIKAGNLHHGNYNTQNTIVSIDGISPCVTAHDRNTDGFKIQDTRPNVNRIRRPTARECFRLMAFTDADYFKCRYHYVRRGKRKERFSYVKEGALYEQAGNSIVVNVLAAIFGNLYGVDWQRKVYGSRYKSLDEMYSELPLFAYLQEENGKA